MPKKSGTIYIGVGVALGAAFGVAIGVATVELNTLIAIGPGLGVTSGIVLTTALSAEKKE